MSTSQAGKGLSILKLIILAVVAAVALPQSFALRNPPSTWP